MDFRTAFVRTSSLEDLLPLAIEAKEDVTFFGHRYVYVNGYEGTLPIDAFALRIMALVSNINFQQHPDERDALEEMIPLITKIYKQSDARLSNSVKFHIVGLRNELKEIFFYKNFCLTPRNYWDEEFRDGYDYTRKFSGRAPFSNRQTLELAQTIVKDAASFADLLPLVKGAKADISFFGCRVVTIENYEGALPIDALAQKVMEIAKNTLDFSQDKSYQEIAPLIDIIYHSSDESKNEKNLLTRVLCSIRDIWNSMWKQRSEWEQNHQSKVIAQDDVLEEI